MTTLTPEKEAELRELMAKATPGRWRLDPATAHTPAYVHGNGILLARLNPFDFADQRDVATPNAALIVAAINALPDLLAALSTERQARESTQFLLADRSTELDWERSARQAAEKEVERLDKAFKRSSMDWLQMVQGLQAKADALVHTLERISDATPNNTNSCSAESMASWTHAVAACALSEGGEPAEVQPGEFGWAPGGYLITCMNCRLRANDSDKRAIHCKPCAQRMKDEACVSVPTQAPQDVAGLVEGDLDWLSKVLDGHRVPYRDVLTGDGGLYCIGKAFEKERVDARIDRILSALRPSPISHETKALVLAAADAAAEGSTAIAPVENGERGSVQILCEEIGFPFSPDLERPEVLVRFVGELIVEIEHPR